jgi:hypothetical protein
VEDLPFPSLAVEVDDDEKKKAGGARSIKGQEAEEWGSGGVEAAEEEVCQWKRCVHNKHIRLQCAHVVNANIHIHTSKSFHSFIRLV